MSINQRIKDLRIDKNITQKALSKAVSIDSSQYSKIELGKLKPTITQLMELSSFFKVSLDWICRGVEEYKKQEKEKNMIPLYAEVETIGGNNTVAEIESNYQKPTMMIDAGDWFKGGTSAIRHYGDSMKEYQSGSTLVVRKLNNHNQIEWGRNYVVETSEMRITKKIAELDSQKIICYSTNTETYPDGRLIHQPITILKEEIRSISRVLGGVNKEESTGEVQLI